MLSRSTILIVGLIVVVAVVAGWVGYRAGKAPLALQPGQIQIPSSPTRADVPPDVVVPDTGAAGLPENVAVPNIVTQAAPGVDSKLRTFDLKVQNNEFVPDTIAVNAGDTVQVNITAVDKNYDLVQPDNGASLQLPKGVTKLWGFQAMPLEGKYTFYCPSCGGPEKGPVGYIIVVKK